MLIPDGDRALEASSGDWPGIQLFGTAQELERSADSDAERLYAARFPDYGSRG